MICLNQGSPEWLRHFNIHLRIVGIGGTHTKQAICRFLGLLANARLLCECVCGCVQATLPPYSGVKGATGGRYRGDSASGATEVVL